MFRPLRVFADVPSLRALLPLSLIGVGYAIGLALLVAAVAVLPGRAWPVAVLISFQGTGAQG